MKNEKQIELEKELSRVNDSIRELEKRKKDIKLELVKNGSSFKEGDKLINPNGESAVFAGFEYSGYSWSPVIRKIKRNGEPYKCTNAMWRHDKWELLC